MEFPLGHQPRPRVVKLQASWDSPHYSPQWGHNKEVKFPNMAGWLGPTVYSRASARRSWGNFLPFATNPLKDKPIADLYTVFLSARILCSSILENFSIPRCWCFWIAGTTTTTLNIGWAWSSPPCRIICFAALLFCIGYYCSSSVYWQYTILISKAILNTKFPDAV